MASAPAPPPGRQGRPVPLVAGASVDGCVVISKAPGHRGACGFIANYARARGNMSHSPATAQWRPRVRVASPSAPPPFTVSLAASGFFASTFAAPLFLGGWLLADAIRIRLIWRSYPPARILALSLLHCSPAPFLGPPAIFLFLVCPQHPFRSTHAVYKKNSPASP